MFKFEQWNKSSSNYIETLIETETHICFYNIFFFSNVPVLTLTQPHPTAEGASPLLRDTYTLYFGCNQQIYKRFTKVEKGQERNKIYI